MEHLKIRDSVVLRIASMVGAAVGGATPTYGNKPTAHPLPVNTQDAYGNARAVLPPRLRPAGIYPDSPTLTAPQVYQPSRRSQRRAGGYTPFGLPGDLLQFPAYRPARSRSATPLPVPAFNTTTQTLSKRTGRAFKMYGGFDPRSPLPAPADQQQMFTRKSGLIRATSFDAPVLRSQWRRPGVGGAMGTLEATPFSQEPAADQPGAAALDDFLVRDVRASYDRERAAAWDRFRDGQYRRAALGFETAYVLDADDFVARIGELFCYVSLDAPRTAVVAVQQLNRRDPNPFTHRIDLADRYGNKEELSRVRIAMRLAAQNPDAVADGLAMNALVLWYLGDRKEAAAAAAAAARAPGGDRYRDWPGKLATAAEAP
jgi:hypothetical protein